MGEPVSHETLVFWRNVANSGRGAAMTSALHDACDQIATLRARLAQVEIERDEANANASKIAIEAIGAAAKMKAAEAERLAENIRSCALGRATRGIDGMIRAELLRIAERVRTNDWEQ